MPTNTALQIDYGIATQDKECSGVLFEIPETEVVAGMELEIILWGNSPSVLTPYALFEGTTTMGSGTYSEESPLFEVVEPIDFAETFKFQAKYPIHQITRIDAINEMWVLDAAGEVQPKASTGQNITSSFSRLGYSCVQELLKTPLYGSAELTYSRSPYAKRWYWTVPANEAGTHWFFLYQNSVLRNKFSIAVPDLADNVFGYKNILLRIYAKGSGVPVGLADVYIDGTLVGQTNAQGEFPVQAIQQGVHTLRVMAAGFVDTSIDTLYNDEFVVY